MVSFELGKEKGKDDFFRLVTSVVVNFFTVIDFFFFFFWQLGWWISLRFQAPFDGEVL